MYTGMGIVENRSTQLINGFNMCESCSIQKNEPWPKHGTQLMVIPLSFWIPDSRMYMNPYEQGDDNSFYDL